MRKKNKEIVSYTAKKRGFTLMTSGKAKSKAFTLIEVLVASSILFIVSAAVVGLSNSIIQSTSVSADSTTANRLATEGLELITKIRDDKVKNASFEFGKFIWFDPVEEYTEYGWYTLEQDLNDSNLWTLDRSDSYNSSSEFNTIDTSIFNVEDAEEILTGLIDYYRLICIEAIGAVNDQKDGILSCNTVNDRTQLVDDGTRRGSIPECYLAEQTNSLLKKDIFCEFTKESLNKNRVSTDKIIADGNAVKIRSVVLWNDKDVYRTAEITTVITNWQSFVQ